MAKVKVYGAGSIGNHLAQACRRIGWEVIMVDADPAALERTKTQIYPSRYGSWDDSIGLFALGTEPIGGFDVIILGTPPDVRMKLALQVLQESPKVILLEKPLCGPSLAGIPEFESGLEKSTVAALVGYDHAVSRASKTAGEIIQSGRLGKPLALDVEFRETWKGIFKAHPWLHGPEDTYLGYWARGGGASGEHSHAVHLWQHFAGILGLGQVKEVFAAMQMVKTGKLEYDQACFFNLTTGQGFVGRVAQDVVTEPVKKSVRIQFENGFLEILVNGWSGGDLLLVGEAGKEVEHIQLAKTRPDDFYEEALHIREILDGRVDWRESPISFMSGVKAMQVVRAAHDSRQQGKVVEI
jgi:predicted dehydrogenase